MDTLINTENSPKFICKYCDYKCYKKSDMTKHSLTKKHIKSEKEYKQNTNDTIPNWYICCCSKKYAYHSGLWKHKKKCSFVATISQDGDKLNYEIENTENSIILDVLGSNLSDIF